MTEHKPEQWNQAKSALVAPPTDPRELFRALTRTDVARVEAAVLSVLDKYDGRTPYELRKRLGNASGDHEAWNSDGAVVAVILALYSLLELGVVERWPDGIGGWYWRLCKEEVNDG